VSTQANGPFKTKSLKTNPFTTMYPKGENIARPELRLQAESHALVVPVLGKRANGPNVKSIQNPKANLSHPSMRSAYSGRSGHNGHEGHDGTQWLKTNNSHPKQALPGFPWVNTTAKKPNPLTLPSPASGRGTDTTRFRK
jgi:hypothetical protein